MKELEEEISKFEKEVRSVDRSNLRSNFFWCVLLLFMSLYSTGVTNAEESLTLGVHPYLPATELVKRFAPLANYLSKKIGQPVTVRVAGNYQEHIDRIGKNKVDIAYMGPASYVKMVDVYGKKPLLARLEINGNPSFQGVIIVRKESTLHTLTDLTGKRFAFGDPDSTMSHLVPRFMLWKAGVDVDKLASYKFLKNHYNVALGVLVGDYDAGAVKEEVFYKYEKRGLKMLAMTPEISEHVFVASNTLPSQKVHALREALYHLKDDKEGKVIMFSIKNSMTGMVPANDEDYDNLRIILQTPEKAGGQS